MSDKCLRPLNKILQDFPKFSKILKNLTRNDYLKFFFMLSKPAYKKISY